MALCFAKRYFIIVMAFSLLLISCAPPAFAVQRVPIVRSDAEYPATPEEVVEEYVRKDAEGVRLSGQKFREIRDLFMWEEAGFDVATIITGYDIRTMDIGPEMARVSVTYRELGEFSPFEFRPDKKEVTESFMLKKDGNLWRITEPEIFPHVLLDTMVSMFERNVEIDPRDDNYARMLIQFRNLKETEDKNAD